jgi:mRNA interferase MazF
VTRKSKTYVPDRGDIVWIHLDPQAGRERAGHRPCLVLSPAPYNGKTGLAILCSITTQAKGYPFEVPLPGGITTTGVVLADHIKSLDWRVRQAKFRERIPRHVVQEVLEITIGLLESDGPAESGE